jgi:hypothetical protein
VAWWGDPVMREAQTLELVFHPARQHPRKAACLGFLLGIALQALWQSLEPIYAVVLGTLLLSTVRDFFLETRYRFDQHGVSVRGALKAPRDLPWQRFRAFVEDRNGLFLTPYKARRGLEQQRGLFLPMTAEQRRYAADYCAGRQLIRRAA